MIFRDNEIVCVQHTASLIDDFDTHANIIGFDVAATFFLTDQPACLTDKTQASQTDVEDKKRVDGNSNTILDNARASENADACSQ